MPVLSDTGRTVSPARNVQAGRPAPSIDKDDKHFFVTLAERAGQDLPSNEMSITIYVANAKQLETNISLYSHNLQRLARFDWIN